MQIQEPEPLQARLAAALPLLAALNFLGREKDMAEPATRQAEGVYLSCLPRHLFYYLLSYLFRPLFASSFSTITFTLLPL